MSQICPTWTSAEWHQSGDNRESGNEGIDRLIEEDTLGLDSVYVQAKHWQSGLKFISRGQSSTIPNAIMKAEKSTFRHAVLLGTIFPAGLLTYSYGLQLQEQESDPNKLIVALTGEDIAARESAMLELKRTPLERLSNLEASLKSPDAEIRIRVQEVFSEVLYRTMGHRAERFALKSVAARDLMEKWTKEGADPSRDSKGYDVINNPDRVQVNEGYDYINKNQILAASVIANEDLKSITPGESVQPGGAFRCLHCDLTEKGAERFDAAAVILYEQRPPGVIAIIVDGKLLAAPVVMSQRFAGHIMIPAKLPTREKALELAKRIDGNWYELSFRLH